MGMFVEEVRCDFELAATRGNPEKVWDRCAQV